MERTARSSFFCFFFLEETVPFLVALYISSFVMKLLFVDLSEYCLGRLASPPSSSESRSSSSPSSSPVSSSSRPRKNSTAALAVAESAWSAAATRRATVSASRHDPVLYSFTATPTARRADGPSPCVSCRRSRLRTCLLRAWSFCSPR